jgi:hypothetical protein
VAAAKSRRQEDAMADEKPPECHWKPAGTGLIPRNEPDNVGIGTTPTKAARLDVKATKGRTAGIRAESKGGVGIRISSEAVAVFAESKKVSGVFATGKVWGVNATGGGKDKKNGGGVRGIGLSQNPGVRGQSGNGVGVVGKSKLGNGVLGSSDKANGVRGTSTEGVGVFGKSGDRAGVVGLSAFGIGVQGLATSQQGVHGKSVTAAGVHGESKDGTGVSGVSKNGNGVDGFSDVGTGVSGITDDGTGVFGETGSIVSAGVFGRNPNGTGVEGFGGTIGVQGKTSDGTGVLGETKSGAGVTGISGSGIALLADAQTGDLIKCISGQKERFRVANNGNVFVNGVTVHTSDARLKTEVAPLGNVLGKLDRIRGVSFLRTGLPHAPRRIGVLAQDVQAVFPELVSAWENEQLAVDYAGLAAVLLEAIKDLQAENADLRRRLEVLEQGRTPATRSSPG